jgi:hypothetical protein
MLISRGSGRILKDRGSRFDAGGEEDIRLMR